MTEKGRDFGVASNHYITGTFTRDWTCLFNGLGLFWDGCLNESWSGTYNRSGKGWVCVWLGVLFKVIL